MESDNETAYVGLRQEWGQEHPFGLEASDRRQHVYVIGQTGTGKSTLLRNLILQDIEAGRGVGLIDPHGDLALDILEHIPSWRTEDVVYFNPLDDDPLAINLFRATADNWHLVASGLVSAFKKIWGDSWGRHVRRIEWLGNNLDAVAKFTGISREGIHLIPLLVTSEIVPMQFYSGMNFPTSQVVTFAQLVQRFEQPSFVLTK